jgi:thiol-disulfide isomerase/thioredoxin
MKKILLMASMAFISAGISAQTYYSEDFETVTAPGLPANANSVDYDGDTHEWETSAGWSAYTPFENNGTIAASRSWTNTAGALSPDNMLILGPIDLTAATGAVYAIWETGSMEGSPYHAEEYSVYVTTSNDSSVIASSTAVFNEVFTVEKTLFTRSVDVSSHIGSTVYLTFRHHNCVDMNMIGLDNITVRTVEADDAELTALDIEAYSVAPASVDVNCSITNLGSSTITSMDVTWTDGTNNYTDNLTGLNIAPFGTYDFTHADQVSISAPGTVSIDVTIDNVNGNADPDMSNNSLSGSASALSFLPTKRVVFEEATGTWCGWCPRGAVALEQLAVDYPETAIGIAVHNGDPMVVADYDNNMNVGGYPSGHVDRVILDVNPGDFASVYYGQRINAVSPVELSATVTFDATTRNIDFTVEGEFVADLSGDFRFNAIIVEDSVTGTGAGWDQANYYSSTSQNIALTSPSGFDWQAAPNPVAAADMVYDHVGRALLGGFDGTAGSLPSSITAGGIHSYDFSHTLAVDQDENHVHVVGVVIDNNTGAILNGVSVSLMGGSNIVEETANASFTTYPNPTAGLTTLAVDLTEKAKVSVNVYNNLGEIVMSENFGTRGAMNHLLNMDLSDLASGLYMIHLNVNEKTYVEKINVAK